MIKKSNTKKPIVIFGSGGFAKEVLGTLIDCNKKFQEFEILGFIDDNPEMKGKIICNIPVLGGIEWFNDHRNISCVIAIGNSKIRKHVFKKLEKFELDFPPIIHPSVIASEFVSIANGVVIQAGTIISPDVKINEHVQINVHSIIGHDCKIESFVTTGPHVQVNGNVVIGKMTQIGSGVITKENIKIGESCIIGAGTVLIRDVADFSMVVGVPGKLKKKL